jgi:cell division septation protein DedD
MQSKRLVALLLSCAATPASAADPWLVAQGVNGMRVTSDASTLTCADGRCSVWEETQYAAPRPDGALSLRDLAYYDCAAGRTRTQMEIKLGVGGRALKTVTASGETWTPVRSGSVGATTLAFACNFRAASSNDLLSGAFNAAGEHFVRLALPAANVAAAAEPSHVQGPPIAVQIAATRTEADAEGAVSAFRRKYQSELAPGLEMNIEQATPKDARVFRVLVEGFSAERDAQGLCARLRASGTDCVIRSIGRGPRG